MGEFRHHHSGKNKNNGFVLVAYVVYAQRYMFQRYMLPSLLTQSFNIANSPIILLFSKKWVPGFAAEDNIKLYGEDSTIGYSRIQFIWISIADAY